VQKFWMVMIEGAREPARQHESLEAAEAEAHRLITHEASGKRAIILEAIEVGAVAQAPITWIGLPSPE
jgi:hypothetical protein